MKLQLQWVSDIIGEEYKDWEECDRAIVNCQTGTGKTYFVKNVLIPYAKEQGKNVLLVVNRVALKRQLKIDLFDLNNIKRPETTKKIDEVSTIGNTTIMSYQSLAEIEYSTGDVSDYIEGFDYVVCDECHFLYADASFNNKCEVVRNALLEDGGNVKMFISATLDPIRNDIEDTCGQVYNYSTGCDYSYLNVHSFVEYEDIIETIKRDISGQKWIVFVTSIEKGLEFKDELSTVKKVNFVNAKNKNTNETLQQIVNDSRFDVDILIATKAIDNGINISDSNVKHIVVMANDETTFVQELGRLRVDIENTDKINLYIPKRNISYFRTLKMMANSKREQIRLFNEDYDAFTSKYKRDYWKLSTDIFYLDDENNWCLNKSGTKSHEDSIWLYDRMIDELEYDKNAFVWEQLSWIGLDEETPVKELKDVVKTDTIQSYILKHINLPLDKDGQQELIEVLGIRDSSRHLLKSISIINTYLQENYGLYVKSRRMTVNGKKITCWIIEF